MPKFQPVSAPASPPEDITEFYRLRPLAIARAFRREHSSVWMICVYLFVEYVRPQSIIPAIDVLPWAKLFLLLSLVTLIADKNRRWVADPTNKWITAFAITIVVSSLLAEFPSFSWQHLIDFFSWYIIYFLIVNIITTEKRLFFFLFVFLIASFKLSFFGARTWAFRGFTFTSWGLQGPPGFFENSGEFSIQMLMFSPIALELALFLRPWLTRVKFWTLLLLPLTGAMSVIGASSRGAQIALAYEALAVSLRGRIKIRVILIVCVIAFAAFSLLPVEQKERFTAAGNDRTSHQRLLYWRHGWEMMKSHPFLGVGFFNFPAYYAKHWPEDLIKGRTLIVNGVPVSELPHNIFVQVGTDCGFLGLTIFVALIFRARSISKEIKALCANAAGERKPFKNLAAGMTVALWGFVIAGQFVTVTYYPFFWINLAMLVALRNIVRRSMPEAPHLTKAASAKISQPISPLRRINSS